MSDWFVNQYGFGPMRKDARTKFVATLNRHKDTNAYCSMFGRLWGVFEPLDEAWCDYYLSWLSPLIEARASKDELVIPVKQGLQYMVRHVYMRVLVCICELARRTWRCRTAVCLSFGPIEKYIKFLVTSACARRTGAAARMERRRRER